MYISKLGDIGHKYNNTCDSTIKMKLVDIKLSTYINSSKEISDEDPRFKNGDIVRISIYKNLFTKGHVPNWSEEVFLIKKVKKALPWTYVISDLKDKEIVATFYEKRTAENNYLNYSITEKSNKDKS